jgi:ectoine hydroxylase-related dioxygenase (phytanoyl-CoA dioxygenase family)
MNSESEIWRKNYETDGFVVIENLLDGQTLFELREKLEEIVSNQENLATDLKGKIFLERQHIKNNPQYYEGILTPEDCGNAVRQIEDLSLFDKAFANLICYQPMLDVMEVLFESSEFSFNYLVGRPKAARVGNGISNGNFHRDTPFEDLTFSNTIIALLCLDDMTGENGATQFIRGSHKVSEEEAKKEIWRDIKPEKLDLENKVAARCPAGSAIFFNTKTLHAAGHNRSDSPRYTLMFEWVGKDVLPTSPIRYAYQGLKPRSTEPAFQKQIKMAFPKLFANQK